MLGLLLPRFVPTSPNSYALG